MNTPPASSFRAHTALALLLLFLTACTSESQTSTLARGYRTITSTHYYYAKDLADCTSYSKSYGELEQDTMLEATGNRAVCNGETLVELQKPPVLIVSEYSSILIPERFLERIDGYSPPPPTKTPMPTEAIVECVGELLVFNYEAYVDANENGKREPDEKPLQGVVFLFTDQYYGRERSHRAISDQTGQASITQSGHCAGPSEFHIEAPPGFRLTTSEGGGWCDRKPCSFGFAVPPVTPEVLIEADLREADLREKDLTQADLSRADLRKANLTGANLSWAKLSGANLSGATLRKADLSKSNLHGAVLRDADLSNANLAGAELRDTDLTNADLSNADLTEARLDGAKMQSANLNGAILYDANLREANLDAADLREADLRGAVLIQADLCGANFDASTQIDSKWRLVCEILSEGAANRDLSGADLSGVDLSGLDLSGANLSGADLSVFILIDSSGGSLYRTILSAVNLRGANLTEADLDFANLSEAILSLANLSGASLWNADLSGADLVGARYDQNTKWPSDFDPIAAGAILDE